MLSCVRGTLRAPFRLASVFHLQLGQAYIRRGRNRKMSDKDARRSRVHTLLCALRLVASLVGTRGTPGTDCR